MSVRRLALFALIAAAALVLIKPFLFQPVYPREAQAGPVMPRAANEDAGDSDRAAALRWQQVGREGQKRSPELMAKLQEMKEVSTKIVSLLKVEYEAGNIGFPRLHEAQHNLLEIERRLANTPADRMKVLSQQLELAKKFEVLITAEYEGGHRSASQIEVLQAQIARMEIELAILEQTVLAPARNAVLTQPPAD